MEYNTLQNIQYIVCCDMDMLKYVNIKYLHDIVALFVVMLRDFINRKLLLYHINPSMSRKHPKQASSSAK